jgi:hypothetical protein
MLTPPICTMGEDEHLTRYDVLATLGNGRRLMMGDDPRLPKMPARLRLVDFFRRRFAPMVANHLLQSARLAREAELDEKVVMACLLHDIAMPGLITGDHGYWGAQLIEPYVDEEVSWAVRYHQALRYFPDESVGYRYPEAYVRYFGEDYQAPDYLRQAYEQARRHKWYMTSRLITVNDLYGFDPDIVVVIDDFEDVIGRRFRQPKEGLGFDNPGCPYVAHDDLAAQLPVNDRAQYWHRASRGADALGDSGRRRKGGSGAWALRRVRGRPGPRQSE